MKRLGKTVVVSTPPSVGPALMGIAVGGVGQMGLPGPCFGRPVDKFGASFRAPNELGWSCLLKK